MLILISINQTIEPLFSMHQHYTVYKKTGYKIRKHIMSFEQSLLHNFKAFPDSMQLLVNLKLLRFEGFSYPEEGTSADDRAPILTGTWFDSTKN